MIQLRIYKPIREHQFYPNSNKKPEKKNTKIITFQAHLGTEVKGKVNPRA